MRRITWAMAIVVCVSLVMAGCGKKNAESIVKDLDQVATKMESYQGAGTMTLHTGQQPQQYQVEVWYKNPHYYRISLTNEKKDITQIVLKNDDGVFVLTPHLNKSFRFQSDWPENQGQVYLYQTLVQSIVMDTERQMTTDGNAYVFDVVANYQNGSYARQKIWLDKKSYAPQQVEVLDSNANKMVVLNFDTFQFNKKFDKDSFDMQRNMTSWKLQSVPTIGQEDDQVGAVQPGEKTTDQQGQSGLQAEQSKTQSGGKDGAQKDSDSDKAATTQENSDAQHDMDGMKSDTQGDKGSAKSDAQDVDKNGDKQTSDQAGGSGKQASSAQDGQDKSKETAQAGNKADFGILMPGYVPDGVKVQDTSEVKLGNGNAVLLRYSGLYNYSIYESLPNEKAVSALTGTVVDLGDSFGVLTEDEGKTLRSLAWIYDGVEFRLTTADMPEKEMVRIAQSVQGQIGK